MNYSNIKKKLNLFMLVNLNKYINKISYTNKMDSQTIKTLIDISDSQQIKQLLVSNNNKELIDYYFDKHKITKEKQLEFIFSLNDDLINMFNPILTKKEQEIYFFPYIKNNYFSPTRHHTIKKYFLEIVVDPIIITQSFQEADLLDKDKITYMLLWNVMIPTSLYKKLYNITTDYTFPSIQKDENGFFTNEHEIYMPFTQFILNQDNTYELVETPNLQRDYVIENFIIKNNIKKISIDLAFDENHNKTHFNSHKISVYPEIIKFTPVYDILYLTDYILKYIYRILILFVIHKTQLHEIYGKNYIIGLEPINGKFGTSSINRHGLIGLCMDIYHYVLGNKLKTCQKFKDDYDFKQANNIRSVVCINYEDVEFSYDKTNLVLHPVKINTVVGLYDSKAQATEKDIVLMHMKTFIDTYYEKIKKKFPIFNRLENIYMMCAFNNIMEKLSVGDLTNAFAIINDTQPIFIEKKPESIMCTGGIVLYPKNYKNMFVPIVPRIRKTITQQNKIINISVIKRGLNGVGFSPAHFSHSALLVETETHKKYILEYGVGENKDVVLHDKIDEFQWKNTDEIHKINKHNISVEELKQIMIKITSDKKYNILDWNCHMAQQKTRQSIGINVVNPYKFNAEEYGKALMFY